MKVLRAGVLGIAALLLTIEGATAADLGGAPRRYSSVKDAPYVAPFTWSGLYVGAHVGYGWSDADWQYDLAPGVSTSHDGRGGLLGGQVGYNWQAGRLVFGLEADAASSWIDGGTSCPNAAVNCGHSINWLASLRGRLGATINDNRTLLYVTAGGAWAEADYAARDAMSGALLGSFTERHFGWVAGAGIEHMLISNMTARIEYLYYGFDGVTAPAGALGAGAAALEPSVQTVRFGLNFKF